MTDEAPPEAPREKKTKSAKNGRGSGTGGAPRASAGGGAGADAWKWGAGALVAALLLGGGYLVMRNTNSAPSNTDVAYNEAPASNSFASETGDAGKSASGGASSPGTQTAARSGGARQTVEETIGVRPASATGRRDNNEIVVPGKRPIWTRKPSERRLATLYPQRALESGREGEARLRCKVENDGALDCVRISETGRDGFGRAAMRVARTLRHGPRLADGSRAYGASIRLRVIFRIADEERRRG